MIDYLYPGRRCMRPPRRPPLCGGWRDGVPLRCPLSCMKSMSPAGRVESCPRDSDCMRSRAGPVSP
eukprot:404907-Prymnesium_polylepis.1